MKRALTPVGDSGTTLTHHEERLSYSPQHDVLLAAFPAAAPVDHNTDPLGDEDGSADVELEEDEGQLRCWKAEQANKVRQDCSVSCPASAWVVPLFDAVAPTFQLSARARVRNPLL
jgi:hypothetical protein